MPIVSGVTKSNDAQNDARGAVSRLVAACLLCLGALILAFDALASDRQPDHAWTKAQRVEREKLFELLHIVDNDRDARAVEQRIWQFWFEPSDPRIADRMAEVMRLRATGDHGRAMEIIDEVIEINPAYPESWNQRATILFIHRDFEASLEAVEETLKREPLHFGALAGQVMIYGYLGQPALAKATLARALKVNPWLRERALLKHLDEQFGIEL